MYYPVLMSVFRYLKSALPPPMSVIIRRVPMNKHDGLCIDRGDHFLIRIDRRLPEAVAIDVLIHEYAHVLSWGKSKDVHGHQWGIAYSLVYRTFLEHEASLGIAQRA